MTTSDRPRLVVRTRRVEGAPVFSIRVWIGGGSRVEDRPGLALVSGRLLAEGTARRDWRRIAEEAESRGVSISATAGYEVQALAIDGLQGDWRLGLGWAAELALESVFPDERSAWVARQTRAELESLADHPDVLAEWGFRAQLYEPHPRGRPLQGTVESLESLTGEQCREFHRRALGRGVIVSVAGTLEPEEVERAANELFAPVASIEPARAEAEEIVGRGRRQTIPLVDGEQAHLSIGALSVTRDDPALVPLELLAVVMGSGSGLVGRIPHRVREVEGLAYACRVATAAGAGLEPGRVEVYLATARDQVDRAEVVVRDELARLAGDGVPAAEVEEARSFLLGREPFRRETARQWAAIRAEAAHYGLPIDRPAWIRDRIAGVSGEQVAEVAARFLDAGRLRITVATSE